MANSNSPSALRRVVSSPPGNKGFPTTPGAPAPIPTNVILKEVPKLIPGPAGPVGPQGPQGEIGPASGEIALVDAQFGITNVGANVVAEFPGASGEMFDIRVYIYSNSAGDPTYKIYRKVVVVDGGIGGGTFDLEAGQPTFGSLNWNVNFPTISAGTLQVTLQTLGADSPRPTRVRVALVRPSVLIT